LQRERGTCLLYSAYKKHNLEKEERGTTIELIQERQGGYNEKIKQKYNGYDERNTLG